MNKILHRAITIIVPLLIFLGISSFIAQGLISVFLAFFVIAVLSVIFICSFVKMPMKCDQVDCNGIATVEVSPEIKDSFLRHILVKGHCCGKCSHLIEMPKGSRR
jgi:hypothetical protein